jgi:hypothetical protein
MTDWAGVRQPIDPVQTFVLSPLTSATPTDPALAAALAAYRAASPAQQVKWATAYGTSPGGSPCTGSSGATGTAGRPAPSASRAPPPNPPGRTNHKITPATVEIP